MQLPAAVSGHVFYTVVCIWQDSLNPGHICSCLYSSFWIDWIGGILTQHHFFIFIISGMMHRSINSCVLMFGACSCVYMVNNIKRECMSFAKVVFHASCNNVAHLKHEWKKLCTKIFIKRKTVLMIFILLMALDKNVISINITNGWVLCRSRWQQ